MPCRYIGRLHDSLRDFSARFSDIDAIHRHALLAQRAQVKPKWWKRLLPSIFGRFSNDSEEVLSFIAALDENQVIEVTADALGATLPAHCGLHERHQARSASDQGFQWTTHHRGDALLAETSLPQPHPINGGHHQHLIRALQRMGFILRAKILRAKWISRSKAVPGTNFQVWIL